MQAVGDAVKAHVHRIRRQHAVFDAAFGLRAKARILIDGVGRIRKRLAGWGSVESDRRWQRYRRRRCRRCGCRRRLRARSECPTLPSAFRWRIHWTARWIDRSDASDDTRRTDCRCRARRAYRSSPGCGHVRGDRRVSVASRRRRYRCRRRECWSDSHRAKIRIRLARLWIHAEILTVGRGRELPAAVVQTLAAYCSSDSPLRRLPCGVSAKISSTLRDMPFGHAPVFSASSASTYLKSETTKPALPFCKNDGSAMRRRRTAQRSRRGSSPAPRRSAKAAFVSPLSWTRSSARTCCAALGHSGWTLLTPVLVCQHYFQCV